MTILCNSLWWVIDTVLPRCTLADIFSNVFTTGCSNILAFFPGNISADFVRHILALFLRYILAYFHRGINTVLSRSVYTDLPRDWVAGNLRNVSTDLVFYLTLNYFRNILADLFEDRLTAVNIVSAAHLVNNILTVLPGDLLALLGGDIVAHLLVDTHLTHLLDHRVADLLVAC